MWLEKGPQEAGQHFPGTNLLAVAPAEKHSPAQQGRALQGGTSPPRAPKPPTHFQKGLKEPAVNEN